MTKYTVSRTLWQDVRPGASGYPTEGSAEYLGGVTERSTLPARCHHAMHELQDVGESGSPSCSNPVLAREWYGVVYGELTL